MLIGGGAGTLVSMLGSDDAWLARSRREPVLGLASYAMRAGGFMAVGSLPEVGKVAQVPRPAPGDFFVAFAAAECLEGGWPSVAGCLLALATMAVTKKEW